MKMHLIKIIKNSKISKSDDEQVIYYFKNSPISTEIDLYYMRPLKREKVREKFNTFCYRDELSAVSYKDALVLSGNNQIGYYYSKCKIVASKSCNITFNT